MKKYLILGSIFFTTFSIYGQSNEKKLDSLFSKLYSQKKFNGNILVAEKGKVVYQNSFGLANEETKENLTENSIFELASVSKQFTAMGIVILKEKEKLSYSDPIGKYIPELSFYKNVTIRNLLQHTSGLPDYMELLDSLLIDESWDSKTKIATNNDIVATFAKYKPKLSFQPNSKWEYSNTGYALLASIIEKASGLTYAEFLKKSIFLPLKMNNSFVYCRRLSPRKLENYAFGYVYSDSLKRNILPDSIQRLDLMVYCLDGIVGDGTVNSTMGDLLKWDRALYTSNLVSQNSLNEIFSSGFLNNKKNTDYGFGWSLENSKDFGKIVKHSGSWPGYKTYIERHLKNDKTIIFLENNDNPKISNPISDIRNIVYDVKQTNSVEVTQTTLKSYAGMYYTEKGGEKEFIIEDGELFIIINPQVKLRLQSLTQTKFKVVGFTPTVEVEFFIENGKVTKHIATQEGRKIEAKKK
jgi:CubicO group peptidase (beta-lactamase class C family)